MSDDSDEDGEPNGGSYEVGYKKPPKQSQFQKGMSGNRKGRPSTAKKKEPSLTPDGRRQAMLDAALRTMTVYSEGKPVEMAAYEVIYNRIISEAAKGSARAIKLALQIFEELELKPGPQPITQIQLVAVHKDYIPPRMSKTELDAFLADDDNLIPQAEFEVLKKYLRKNDESDG